MFAEMNPVQVFNRVRPFLLSALGGLLLVGPVSSTAASASHKAAPQPDVKSAAVLVLDSSDSSVVFQRRPDLVMPIASITKLMTALVVLDGKLPLDERIAIGKDDCSKGKGAYSRLSVGTVLTRADLLHLALMSSENRAAHALGRNYPGGVTAFVDTMNAKARALGMTRTHFVDPSGLSSDNVASARDLAKLILAASRSATIREYSTSKAYTVRVGRRMQQFRNTNSLVGNPAWQVEVQKTGYISEAGHCLVMQATIEERPIVMVLLNSFGKYTRVADAKRIRQWLEARDRRTALAVDLSALR